MTDLAAAQVFDQPRRDHTRILDRDILTIAAGFERFTNREVTDEVGSMSYGRVQQMTAALVREGHLRAVNPGCRPLIYEWVEP